MKILFGIVGFLIVLILILVMIKIVRGKKELGDDQTNKRKGGLGSLKENVWSIALVIVGALVVYFGIYSSSWEPRFADVGRGAWGHFFSLMILFGIVYSIIAINEKKMDPVASKALKLILSVAVVTVFLFSPIAGWVAGLSNSGGDGNGQQSQKQSVDQEQKPSVVCPDMSAEETRSCEINSDWSGWIKTDSGMHACASPAGQFERKDEDGMVSFRFKTNGGTLKKSYRLFAEDQKCPETLPE